MAIQGVCRHCNHVVLGGLENDAFKPLLLKTLDEICVLFMQRDQRVLAAWITRFAMVADLVYRATDQPPYFTSDARKTFIDSFEPPSGTLIWLGSIDSACLAGCSVNRGERIIVCTGIIGRLMFQFRHDQVDEQLSEDMVARSMEPVLSVSAPWTVQIYPITSDLCVWPPPEHFEIEGFSSFATRWGGKANGPRLSPV
jgi:hypothetical protein